MSLTEEQFNRQTYHQKKYENFHFQQ